MTLRDHPVQRSAVSTRVAAALRRAVVVTATLLLALSASVVRVSVASSPVAPTGSDLQLLAIHAAVDDLQRDFFHPVTGADALSAAWLAVTKSAKQAGVDATAITPPGLAGSMADDLKSFDVAYRALTASAGAKLDPRVAGNAAIAAVASSVHENHTYFIDAEHWRHRADTSTQYAGIGITLTGYDNAFYVSEVYSGSPAAKAGLRPGDRFVSVGGSSVAGLNQNEMVSRLRGEPGSRVTIEVRHGDGSLLTEITREAIVVAAFESRVLDDGVGYLRLRSFPPAGAKLPGDLTLAQALDAALDGFDQAGVTAWVLDLRNNGGGYLDGMVDVANRFLPANTTVMISHTQGGDATTRTFAGARRIQRPLSVLINGASASASEILTAALQENGRAMVVGDRSAGVANAANLDALPNGGGLSITSVQTLTPLQRRPLDGAGVVPDVAIAGSIDDVPLGRDRQLERAAAVATSGTTSRELAGADLIR